MTAYSFFAWLHLCATHSTISFYQNLGTIPSEIGRLEHLKVLYLDHNQFSGTLPTEMGLLKNAELFSSFGNRLNGTIPTELGELTASTQLSLWGNQFTGTVPSQLGRLTDLTVTLNMKNNGLTGTLPTELGLLLNLYELEFQEMGSRAQFPASLVGCLPLASLVLPQTPFLVPCRRSCGPYRRPCMQSRLQEILSCPVPFQMNSVS